MKKNSGSTMLAVLAMLVVISAFTYGALNFTATLARNVMGSNTYREAVEVGDGALDYMFANWREIMKENTTSAKPPTSSAFANIPLPPASLFPTVSNYTASRNLNPTSKTATKYTIANYCVQAVDPQMNPYVIPPVALPNTPVAQTCLADQTNLIVGYGMSSDQNSVYYLASCDVTLPAFGGRNVTVQMRRVFQRQITSPWEYALFYNDLLEVNPGAPMNINGWVHTNGNLYTAGNGSGTQELTFQSKADYAGDWAYNPITFAPGDADHSTVATTPNNGLPSYPSNLPPARGETQLPFGMDPTQIFTNTDSNNTGYIELIQPPVASQPDPIATARYYNQADIVITVSSSGSITLTNGNGTPLTSSYVNSTTSGATPLDKGLYSTFSSAVSVQNNAFADNREAATMNIINVDLSKLATALTGSGSLVGTGFQGVVYVYNSSTSTSTRWGVRLKNGATIKSPGLTVASQNPVYIQGDFNTGQTGSSKTPANTANNSTGNNIVSGYQEQSCAVIADAVNILSNAWVDDTSISSPPNATPTTVNAAIVSGIVPTSSAYPTAQSYSGGAENFPRFLENWGSQTFTYYGSMVELYQSKQSTGRWGKNNVYSAPNRSWHFDPIFYTQPPPGTLQITTYAKQRWYVQ